MATPRDTGFGSRLKYILQQNGMSQYQLAHRSGLSESTISKYINGESYPNYKSLESIARGLDVPLYVLFDLLDE